MTPVIHPTLMTMLLTRSTGTMSAFPYSLHRMTLNIPFPVCKGEGGGDEKREGKEEGGIASSMKRLYLEMKS